MAKLGSFGLLSGKSFPFEAFGATLPPSARLPRAPWSHSCKTLRPLLSLMMHQLQIAFHSWLHAETCQIDIG